MKAWKVRSRIFDIQRENGNAGLRAEFPKLLEEHPDLFFVYKEYAQFLLREKQLVEAKEMAERGLKKFPNQPALIVLGEGIAKAEEVKSEEQKANYLLALQSELMTVNLAALDCMNLGTE